LDTKHQNMNRIDHFTVMLPHLSLVVSFVRINNQVAYHGAKMVRSDGKFETEGEEKSGFLEVRENVPIQETFQTLARMAACELCDGSPETMDILREQLLEAINSQAVWS